MNRRGKNPNENPGVKPVKKIELSENGKKKRLIIAVCLLLVGLFFIGYALISYFKVPKGWQEITATRSSQHTVSGDLTFMYELGVSGKSTASEQRAIADLYTQACEDAKKLFDADYGFEGIKNPYYINKHFGEEIEIDQYLYKAFSLLEEEKSRILFAAPYYDTYANIFSDTEDKSVAEIDPYKNEGVATYFKEVANFVNEDTHVKLELLGENKVKLVLSKEYLAFARENAITKFIDFYWLKNAFIVDYIADLMIEKGYTYGNISSYDGYIRNLDTRETQYAFNLFTPFENKLYTAGQLQYTGRKSIVYLRGYSVNDKDDRYYFYQDGEVRHAYIDVTDGLCKNSLDNLVSYSTQASCAEVLLSMIPAYIAKIFEETVVEEMKIKEIYSVYFEDNYLYYNENGGKIENLYKDKDLEFICLLKK